MAAANGRASTDLNETLLREPQRFEFFQAVRLLERLRPNAPVGQDAMPDQEVVRFRALPSLSFPAAEINRLRHTAERGPLEMVVSFLGLTGPSAMLPQHYTTLLLRRMREKDHALHDFLDLFNHRLVSLFYRAWQKYRLPIAFETSRLGSEEQGADPVSTCLYCLVGLGTDGLRHQLSIADDAFLYYAGHFTTYPRSALALQGILQDYFDVPIHVEQAQGQWLTLEEDSRSVLPGADYPQGQNNKSGLNLIVGDRVWDVQSKFRLRLGPLTYDQFRHFLPSGDGLRALSELTRSYVGVEFDFDVLVALYPEEVPWCRLESEGPDRPQLGWNTWVRSIDMERVAEDAVVSVTDL
jgi:type VI secretion system protein ImpH